MAKDSFVFYKSFYDAIKKIPDEYQLELYNAILSYSLEGLEPSDLSPIAEAMFILIKPNIDSSQKRYETSVENGKRGGRPKQETQDKPNQNPKETQRKPKDNLQETQDKPNQNLNEDEDVNENIDNNEDDNNEKEKNKKRKTFEDVFKEKSVSNNFKNTLKDFIDMRKTIKKPMTSKALELLINKVRKMSTIEQEQIDILNQSIERGWQTVYPLKTTETQMQNSKGRNE